ncbi:MAG: pyruvate, water dikinase regulatory protein [Ornithinimicrobium sp.]
MAPAQSPIQLHVLADSTGDTAARVARAAAAQYAGYEMRIVRHPRLSSADGVRAVLDRIDPQGSTAVVFSTIVDPELRAFAGTQCEERGIPHAELLDAAVAALTQATGAEPERTVRPVGVGEDYFARIQAMEFSIANDDGKFHNPLREADIVLIGVSRSGKTPLAMYLGYLGYRTANIPLVPGIAVPEELWQVDRHKIIGLTIDPERLHAIRSRRVTAMGSRIDRSGYADLGRIFDELDEISALQRKFGCPVIDTTQLALEEAAGRVIELLERRAAMNA